LNRNGHKPDKVRLEVIEERLGIEQNGGSNERINILLHLLAEAWTGTQSVTLPYLSGADREELTALINAEVEKRKRINHAS
jgi:hypothetical protein